MRSEQIQYFLEVAQCGSMSEVAEKNFLTQPAVSTAITKLEKELDVQLLTRSNHGVVLTEAGCTAQQLLLQIQQLSQQLYNSLEPYRTKSSVKEKPLNICTTLEIGKYLVDPAVAHFRQLYPQSAVSVREYDFLDILSAVGQGQCDNCILNASFVRLILIKILRLKSDIQAHPRTVPASARHLKQQSSALRQFV